MTLQRENIDGSLFRRVLTAVITNNEFLEKFYAKLNEGFFTSPFAGIITGWCLTYFDEYGCAPKAHIRDLYDDAVRTGSIHKAELELIENLLNTIDFDYEEGKESNTDYLLAEARKLAKTQDLEALKIELDLAIESSDTVRAEELVKAFSQQNISGSPDKYRVKIFEDKSIADKVYSHSVEPLLKLKGAVGEMLNPLFVRGGTVSLRARSKKGKSWWLSYIAQKASGSRLNVAIIQMGDMNEVQWESRFFTSLTGKPRRPVKTPHKVPILDCARNQDDTCPNINRKSKGRVVNDRGELVPEKDVPDTYRPCTRCEKKNIDFPGAAFYEYMNEVPVMTPNDIKMFQKIMRVRTRGKHFEFVPYSSNSINTDEVVELLRIWKKEGWTPDLIVMDYPELMKPETGTERFEERRQIDERWKNIRKISLDWNVLILAVDQGDADSYDTDTVRMSNFSGSRTKNDHLTAAVSLNSDPREAKLKIVRLATMFAREVEVDEERQVAVLQDLSRGQVCIDSFFVERKIKPAIKKS